MAFDSPAETVGVIAEFWAFMRVRKKWWLSPILLMLGMLGFIAAFTQGSALVPFIYPLF